MSSVTDYPTKATNISSHPSVGALKETLRAADQPVQWLVIADDDPTMLLALQDALQGESAAILQSSRGRPIDQDNEVPTAIEWSLQNSSIRNVLLVGHSEAIGATCQSVPTPSSPEGSRSETRRGVHPSASPLLERINRNNARQQAAMKSFGEQFALLAKVPAIEQRCVDGELTLYGLYYRAESGVFLAYDADENQYRPLVTR